MRKEDKRMQKINQQIEGRKNKLRKSRMNKNKDDQLKKQRQDKDENRSKKKLLKTNIK